MEVALVRIAVVLVIVLFVTLPFGFYRAYTRKLTLRWFLAIHVPVVFVFLTRYEAHLSYWYIPFTCTAFATAQIVGSRIGRWWRGRRAVAVAVLQQKTPLKQGIANHG